MNWLTLAYKMLRPRTVLMMLLFTAIGDAAVKRSTTYDPKLILAGVLLGCLFVSATSVNDIADEEIDKINLSNDKRRPLVTSKIQKKHLRILNVVAFGASLVVAFWIKPFLAGLVLVAVFLSYIYSMPPVRISYRGLLAPLLLPLNYVAIPFIIGIVINSGSFTWPIFILLVGLYVSFVGRIILKDFRDVKGDALFGKRTFLVRYGAIMTCQVAGLAWLLGDIIISGWFIRTEPLLVTLIQLFVIAIFFVLHKLAYEKQLVRQLTLVNLVGRLGNSIALCMLTSLTVRLYPFSEFKKTGLLLLVTIVSVYASYYLFDFYKRQAADRRSQ